MTPNQKPVLLATAYLPPVEYVALMLRTPVIVEQHETYPKQTYRNRCYLYTEKGAMALSIPLRKPSGNHSGIMQIQIVNEDKWYLRHWRAIEAAYNASPYFFYYRDQLAPFFRGVYNELFPFNQALTKLLCELIGFTPEINYTDCFEKDPKEVIDLRYRLAPKNKPLASHFPQYMQVFSDRYGFIPNLSIIDLLFNLGPQTKSYLNSLNFQ